MTYLSIVIPIYNSEQSLEELYYRLTWVLNGITDDYEMIMVDDASCDNSFLQAKAIHDRDSRVKVIRLAHNFGQQNALLCGFRYASGEIVITIDDDLQHPPEEIPTLLEKLAQGYDAVLGIPRHKKHAFYRNFGSCLIDILFRFIVGKPRKLKLSSFRALKKTLVQQIQNETTDFVYLTPLILKYTRKVANVLVEHAPRKYGRSNYDLRKLVQLCIKLIRYYSDLAKFFPPKIGHSQYDVREIHF